MQLSSSSSSRSTLLVSQGSTSNHFHLSRKFRTDQELFAHDIDSKYIDDQVNVETDAYPSNIRKKYSQKRIFKRFAYHHLVHRKLKGDHHLSTNTDSQLSKIFNMILSLSKIFTFSFYYNKQLKMWSIKRITPRIMRPSHEQKISLQIKALRFLELVMNEIKPAFFSLPSKFTINANFGDFLLRNDFSYIKKFVWNMYGANREHDLVISLPSNYNKKAIMDTKIISTHTNLYIVNLINKEFNKFTNITHIAISLNLYQYKHDIDSLSELLENLNMINIPMDLSIYSYHRIHHNDFHLLINSIKILYAKGILNMLEIITESSSAAENITKTVKSQLLFMPIIPQTTSLKELKLMWHIGNEKSNELMYIPWENYNNLEKLKICLLSYGYQSDYNGINEILYTVNKIPKLKELFLMFKNISLHNLYEKCPLFNQKGFQSLKLLELTFSNVDELNFHKIYGINIPHLEQFNLTIEDNCIDLVRTNNSIAHNNITDIIPMQYNLQILKLNLRRLYGNILPIALSYLEFFKRLRILDIDISDCINASNLDFKTQYMLDLTRFSLKLNTMKINGLDLKKLVSQLISLKKLNNVQLIMRIITIANATHKEIQKSIKLLMRYRLNMPNRYEANIQTLLTQIRYLVNPNDLPAANILI